MRRQFLSLLVATTAACQGKADPFKTAQTPADMKTAIGTEVPMGTPSDSAARILERHGFKCELKTNASFEGRDHLTYEYCDRSDNAGGSVSRRWQVALLVDSEHVADVLVTTGLIGP